MNILISHQWLLDHLQTKASPEKIQEYLSLCGPSVETVTQVNKDYIYDIEVTTNRVDSLSVHGLAREAAVILNRFELKAQLKPLKLKTEFKVKAKDKLPLPKIKNDPQLCQRILAVVLKNCQQTKTPQWMAQRLEQIGVQVHHSVIDITNYVTHDLGHPCHAFDYDKIMALGGEIIVTTAKKGEKFVTLDGVEYTTIGGEIVFKNPQGEIIDLPAIKGTKNTSVDQKTTNVLFWIENLDAKKVRFASMTHAIRTVAAQLNEKQVDPHLGKTALLRGIQLYQDLAKATVASEIYDEFPQKTTLAPVTINKSLIDKYLGLSLTVDEIKQILEQLVCQVTVEQANQADQSVKSSAKGQQSAKEEPTSKEKSTSLIVKPPTFRPDLQIPVDIIEEIARIYGYHNLDSQLMTGPIPVNKPLAVNFSLENKVKHFLSNLGWQEVYTYSMVSEKLALQAGYELEEQLKLANPLTEDHVYLRRSLTPSLVQVLAENPQAEDLSVFELANIYVPQKGQIPDHQLKLGLVSCRPYRQVKGELEALLQQFYLKKLKIEQRSGQTGELVVSQDSKKHQLGTIKVLTPALTSANDKKLLTAIELDFTKLVKLAKKYPNYQPIPKTSPIIEDLTFTVKGPQTGHELQPIGRMMDQLKASSNLIVAIKLKDVYQQNYTFTIQYLDPEKNLTSEEIKPIRAKAVAAIEEKFAAKLVGLI